MSTLERWRRWWKDAGCDGNPDAAFARFMPRCLDASRAFHNASHIEYCLDKLEDFKSHSMEQLCWSAVEAALWLHISHMEFKKEIRHSWYGTEKNVELLRDILTKGGMPKEYIELAARCLGCIPNGSVLGYKTPEMLLSCDISIMILAEASDTYERYSDMLRKEFTPFYTAEKYVHDRIEFLAREITSSTVFCLPAHRTRLNKRAQRNMAQEIVRLIE